VKEGPDVVHGRKVTPAPSKTTCYERISGKLR
jgi:hypothetical protein